MSTVTVSQKGWVVIPAELRRRYGWKQGTRVKVVDYGGIVALMPVMRNPVEEAWGALRVPGKSLLEDLKEAKAEERRLEKRRKK